MKSRKFHAPVRWMMTTGHGSGSDHRHHSSSNIRITFHHHHRVPQVIGCLLYTVIVVIFFSHEPATSASSSSPPMIFLKSLWNSGQPIVDYYITSNQSINFTHLAYDKQYDRLYAGASNRIFQFNGNLQHPIHQLETGPLLDNPHCPPVECNIPIGDTPNDRVWTTNFNKILVIDERSKKLIACGSVHQGSCRRHSLEDIRRTEPLIPIPVAANDENSSTYAFVGPSYYGDFGPSASSVLYVATTNTRLGSYREIVPAIASRSLESGPKLFSVIEQSFSDTAMVNIESHLRDYYLVKYVYGFYTQDFVYFATIQKRSHLRALEEWGYHTRLARICSSDAAYNTYTEITLQCVGSTSGGGDGHVHHYPLLQDAIIINASGPVAHDLGIRVGSSILVGIFSTAKDHTWIPDEQSAICVYSIEEIERKFTENIHLCYNGSALTRNMDYIAGNIKDCPEPGTSNVASFCSETLKLNGSIPITALASIEFSNETLTSLLGLTVATPSSNNDNSNNNILFTGTSRGHLKKILLRNIKHAEQFDEIPIHSGHAILADMLFDQTERFIYAATRYKISKVQIDLCSSSDNNLSTCVSCVGAKNPFCGWCESQNRCTNRYECSKSSSVFSKMLKNIRPQNRPPSSIWISDIRKCTTDTHSREVGLKSFPIDSDDLLVLKIDQTIPFDQYQCVFNGVQSSPTTTTRAVFTSFQSSSGELVCRLPPIDERPSIPKDSDHITLDLTIRSETRHVDIVHRKYTFYDCSVHMDCLSCLTSNWRCNFCSHSNVCTASHVLCGHHQQHPYSHQHHQQQQSSPSSASPSLSSSSSVPQRLSHHNHHYSHANIRNSIPSIDSLTNYSVAETLSPSSSIDGGSLWLTSVNRIRNVNECPGYNWPMNGGKDGKDGENDEEKDVGGGERSRDEDEEESILIPSDVSTEISLKVKNLSPQSSGNNNNNHNNGNSGEQLWCSLLIEDNEFTVTARRINHPNSSGLERIVCSPNIYTFSSELASLPASLSILSQITSVKDKNQQHPSASSTSILLDRFEVTMYKCHLLGAHAGRSDCSLCHNLRTIYGCNWCDGICKHYTLCSNSNELNDHHLESSSPSRSPSSPLLLSSSQPLCPPPRIDFIEPLSGPLEGGTMLTIEGSNLGTSRSLIVNRILVGNSPCDLIDFNISVRIVCRTRPVHRPTSVTVKVLDDKGNVLIESREKFAYKTIHLTGNEPKFGPKSGGTMLTLLGKNLNIGSFTQIFLDSTGCPVDRRVSTSDQIVCRTSPSPKGAYQVTRLVVKIDDYEASLAYPFLYTENPTITSIVPKVSFMSGGRLLRVSGTNLTSLHQHARLALYSPDGSIINTTVCDIFNDTQMICPSPPISPSLMINLPQSIRRISSSSSSIHLYESSSLANNLAYSKSSSSSPASSSSSLSSSSSQSGLTSTDDSRIALNVGLVFGDGISQLHSSSNRINFPLSITSAASSSSISSPSSSSSSFASSFAQNRLSKASDLIYYVPDPTLYTFTDDDGKNSIKSHRSGEPLVISGLNLNRAATVDEVKVNIGKVACNLTSLMASQLVCIPSATEIPPMANDADGDGSDDDNFGHRSTTTTTTTTTSHGPAKVVVSVGRNLRYEIGHLVWNDPSAMSVNIGNDGGSSSGGNSMLRSIVVLILCGIVVAIVILTGYAYVNHRNSLVIQCECKRIYQQMDILENSVRSECKQEFAELQSYIIDLTNSLASVGIPTQSHRVYVMKVLFPGVYDHPLFQEPKLRINGIFTGYELAMNHFEQLLNSKIFLLAFVSTLENQKTFTIRDKINVASLLTIIFMERMEYATDILKTLLEQLVEKSVHSKHPQLMLRRTESIVEKMLTNWLALNMYHYVRENISSGLFLLFQALKYQLEKGPVDAVTHQAKYSLSDERNFRGYCVESNHITIEVYSDYDEHTEIENNLLDRCKSEEKITCHVLDCDTISQVKVKILDNLYRTTPFSRRPCVHDTELIWLIDSGNHLVLSDIDYSSKVTYENGINWKQLNTLKHYTSLYGVQSKYTMSLVMKQSYHHHPSSSPPSTSSPQSYASTLTSSCVKQQQRNNILTTSNMTINESYNQCEQNQHQHLHNSSLYSRGTILKRSPGEYQRIDRRAKFWHLVKPEIGFDSTMSWNGYTDRGHSVSVPAETHLIRLLIAKGSIQKFIDDSLATILSVNDSMPPAIKWLFDLLDELAIKHGITDREVIFSWKSNALPLRFWVNFIKNPDFILDVHKNTTLDSCLSVIAQTLMDACSSTDHQLGKNSPPNKLLFAKDIPIYRNMVTNFYQNISSLVPISEQEMKATMQCLSLAHSGEFDVICALKELYVYAAKYWLPLMETIENDPLCREHHLAQKFANISSTMNGEMGYSVR